MKSIKENLLRMQTLTLMLALIVSVFALSSCDDDDDPDDLPEGPTETITEIVEGNDDFSILLAALRATGLDATLDGTGTFTVFAPDNEAFDKLPAGTLDALLLDPDALEDILLYHVLGQKVLSGDLSSGSVPTLLSGQSLDIVVDGSSVTINGTVMVTMTDIEATNGVVHVIDAVLLPETEPELQSIAEIASATSDLSILVEILSKPELADILAAASNDDAELTVFAPTNAAFEAVLTALGKSTLDDLPVEALLEIVQYHIVPAVAFSGDLEAITYPTLLGEDVTITLDGGGVQVDGVDVATADIAASNGVVHVIGEVLLPSLYKSAIGTIVEIPLFTPDFSILTAALKEADLVQTLIDIEAVTVFAPNNAAFEAAGITSLEGLDAEALTPILLYHVVGGKVFAADLPSDGIVTTLNDAYPEFYLSLGSTVYINGTTTITGTDIENGNGVIHTIDRTLLPPTQTIAEIVIDNASGDPAEFTTLLSLVTAEGREDILNALSSEGNLTVFAPTDAAFEEISSTVETLTFEQITEVLQYHVTEGRIFSTDLTDGISPAMLNGETITINLGDAVTIDDQGGTAGIEVVMTNIHATNGVIHVINKVLIPDLSN